MSYLIRLVEDSDAAAIQAIYAPFVLYTPITSEFLVPDAAEIQQRIEKTLSTFPWLICEYEREVVGYAYARQHCDRQAFQWSVETSVYLHEKWQGRKIGRALYTSLFALLRLQGFYNICAGITLPNAASIALHEAMGMERVGIYHNVTYKLGTWHDKGWWHALLQPLKSEPDLPIKIPTAIHLPDWQEAMDSGLRVFS